MYDVGYSKHHMMHHPSYIKHLKIGVIELSEIRHQPSYIRHDLCICKEEIESQENQRPSEVW